MVLAEIPGCVKHIKLATARSASVRRWLDSKEGAEEAATSWSAYLCAHPVFPLDTFQSYLTFVLSARRPRCCQQSLNLPCRNSEIFVNPAWSVILTPCHFDAALLPPWSVLYVLPAMCLRFAPVFFVLLLFRFRFIILKEEFFPAELRWAVSSAPFFDLHHRTQPGVIWQRTPSKKGVSVHKNSFAPCQIVSSQRRATRSDVSFQTKHSECLVAADLAPNIYSHLRETLWFFKVICFPVSWSRQETGIVWIKALLAAVRAGEVSCETLG